jgi:hypothetical protein
MMKREFLMWRVRCTAGKLSLWAGGCLDTVNFLVPVRASAERVQSARRNEDPYQRPRCRLSQDVSYRAILVGSRVHVANNKKRSCITLVITLNMLTMPISQVVVAHQVPSILLGCIAPVSHSQPNWDIYAQFSAHSNT